MLQDIADQTGGTYYPVAQATGLTDAFEHSTEEVVSSDTDSDGLTDGEEAGVL